MADFILRALLAGLMVAIIAGPLGCFVVWRRMSYFGDTLAHSALFGIALGLLLDINLELAVIMACMLLAVVLVMLENRRGLSTDTILGILAHSSLALGLVIISFTDNQVNLMAYLFGDLLTVSTSNLIWIGLTVVIVLGVLFKNWNRLLTITLHEELAQVEGLNVLQLRLLLMMLIALIVAVSMKVVGVLLITSLLIIPPACARAFTKTPETMSAFASMVGCIAVCGGLAASWFWDTPTGPSIVVATSILFVISRLAGIGEKS
ncbi:MAG: zinc transport system permease protein [Pseudohongiellaceae bacterium]|jgi:zinc transport system permease protein|tara:strand:- start:1990 stop:2778 length:789 start_codon:yes stop_codon:yes gene_type:complete